MTRCRAGDIARIAGLPPELGDANDRIVRVTRLVVFNNEPAWALEARVEFVVSGDCRCAGTPFNKGDAAFFDRLQDKYLRPIRGLPGDDETLTWVGKPTTTNKPAEQPKEATCTTGT